VTKTRLPQLRGARVQLRAQRAGDVPALFAIHSDPVVMRYWSFPPWQHVEQAQEMFKKNDRGRRSGEFLPWAIALNADVARDGNDALIGTCSLFALDTTHRRAMIGYALARAHWGRGYAQEALRLALEHAFNTLALNRVEADVDPRNTASMRLLERCGFKREGVLRERWRVGDDVQDSAIYGLLARDHAATASTAGAARQTAGAA
jgi:ribosomal-protein-alanine N-acetyltransferase